MALGYDNRVYNPTPHFMGYDQFDPSLSEKDKLNLRKEYLNSRFANPYVKQLFTQAENLDIFKNDRVYYLIYQSMERQQFISHHRKMACRALIQWVALNVNFATGLCPVGSLTKAAVECGLATLSKRKREFIGQVDPETGQEYKVRYSISRLANAFKTLVEMGMLTGELIYDGHTKQYMPMLIGVTDLFWQALNFKEKHQKAHDQARYQLLHSEHLLSEQEKKDKTYIEPTELNKRHRNHIRSDQFTHYGKRASSAKRRQIGEKLKNRKNHEVRTAARTNVKARGIDNMFSHEFEQAVSKEYAYLIACRDDLKLDPDKPH